MTPLLKKFSPIGFLPSSLDGLQLWLDSSREGFVKSGNSAQFTSANSEYLSIADNAALSMGDIDFTIGAWVYFDSLSTQRPIIAKFDSSTNNREYLLRYLSTSSRLQFAVSNNGTTSTNILADSLGLPIINTWYFVLAWHDATANTINIQVNNGTADSTAYSTGVFDGNSIFEIGANSVVSQYHYGRIQYPFVFKRVLTAAERTYLYNSGNGRRSNELGLAGTDGSNLVAGASNGVGWWDLGEESGTRADSFGSNTLTDNATVTQNDGVSLKDAVNNSNVRQATDLSGNSNDMTQTGNVTRKPLFNTAQVNGKPAIILDGTDDFLLNSSPTGLDPLTNDFTWVAVIKHTTATSGRYFTRVSSPSTTRFWFGRIDTVSQFVQLHDQTGGTEVFSAITSASKTKITDGNYHIVISVCDRDGNWDLYIDGVKDSTTTSHQVLSAVSINPNQNFIVGSFDGSSRMNGGIAELAIYNRVLNAGELSRLNRYLGRKYSISVT